MVARERVTAHEATVKTAAVEVKTLTISGKQVTLAVFRQLIGEPLIDLETAELRGVPWGNVNYFGNGCTPDHLHTVWQLGDSLRRSCVIERPPSTHYTGARFVNHRDSMVDRMQAHINNLGLALLGVMAATGWKPKDDRHDARFLMARTADQASECWASEAIKHLWAPPYDWKDRTCPVHETYEGTDHACYQERQTAKQDTQTEMVLQEAEQLAGMRDADVIRGLLTSAMERRSAFIAKWAAQYSAIAALDQLFIAV